MFNVADEDALALVVLSRRQTSPDGPSCMCKLQRAFKKYVLILIVPYSGSGLAPLSKMNKPLASVIPAGVKHYPSSVTTFSPDKNSLKTSDDATYSFVHRC